jgi:hypothetical protein
MLIGIPVTQYYPSPPVSSAIPATVACPLDDGQ